MLHIIGVYLIWNSSRTNNILVIKRCQSDWHNRNRVKNVLKIQWFSFPKNEKMEFCGTSEGLGTYIVRNIIRRVRLPVKVRDQPSLYNRLFWRLDFCRFCPNFSHHPPRRAQNHQTQQYFPGINLSHLRDTLGDLEPQLEFYRGDG